MLARFNKLVTGASLFCASVFGALPVTHVVLADQWFRVVQQRNLLERREFLLGTLFPDIRYVAGIPRSNTHPWVTDARGIQNGDRPFLQGILFHSYVDQVRAQFMNEHRIHELLPQIPDQHRVTFYKLLEDEVLYDKINIEEIHDALYHGSPDENELGIDPQAIAKWHDILYAYVSMKPSDFVIYVSKMGRGAWGITPDLLKEWGNLLKKLSQEAIVQEYIHEMIALIRSKIECDLASSGDGI